MSRPKEEVYSEIIREIYIKVFKKNLNAAGWVKHLKHITKNFPIKSPSRMFAYSIRLQRQNK